MQYKKSHRDQKCRPYATKALENGCGILEVDIQSACGVLVLGHNWRPKLPFLFDCTFKDYLKRLPNGVVLQIDVKEICLTSWGRKRFAERVVKLLESHKESFTIIVSANSGFKRPATMLALISILRYSRFRCGFWTTWKIGKNIQTVDLW